MTSKIKCISGPEGCHHVMATGRTVRQVKQGARLRRSQTSLNPVSSPEVQLEPSSDVAKVIKAIAFVKVEGYGPYKPVPPPEPLLQQAVQTQGLLNSGYHTPPPYRMPPYPLYNEPSIPGAAVRDQHIATSSQSSPQGLHTHSSKFPIEREVLLTSTDKNSKIPILHEYKKKTKVAVAPDIPLKQMAAWTQGQIQNHQILPDQTHPGLLQTIQQASEPNLSDYRPVYHQVHDYYNSQNANSTGAVPRTAWHGTADSAMPTPRSLQPNEEFTPSAQTVSVQIESKDIVQKQRKNSKTMTKTYHTIKDIISSKFKSTKDNEEETEDTGLNNITDELRKSQVNIVEDIESKKAPAEQNTYGKQPLVQQHLYSQNLIQQQKLTQHAKQQYQQQLKSQQYSQKMAQARSQELLTPRPEEQIYYQSKYVISHQRNAARLVQVPNMDGSFVAVQQNMQQYTDAKEAQSEDRRPVSGSERRSAQQLERDCLRQRSFEARRAASQPQLAFDDEMNSKLSNNRPQPQIPIPIRRGSYGNIMEASIGLDAEKDSDDGGFLKRLWSQERRIDIPIQKGSNFHNDGNSDGINNDTGVQSKDEKNITESLQEAPRKQLEGEIGKIEGVYNIGQRAVKVDDASKTTKKASRSSANSSDYDKAGGQSSSNVDSGRGSAAYSSGRRLGGIDLNEEQFDNGGSKYKDIHAVVRAEQQRCPHQIWNILNHWVIMWSKQVFDVYRSPMSDESIERIETRTHHPYVKSFQNNDIIEIAIQQSDAWLLMYDAAINVQGRLTRTAGAGTIKFVNNAGAFMFESLSYELNGKELDNVRKPAIVSTLRGYACYEVADSNYLGSAGWNYPLGAMSTDGSFNMWIPLRHLFGIFNDYTLATCGKQTLRLVRSRSDKSCASVEEVAAPVTPTKFELTINSVVLKVKHIFPNDEIRMNLLQSIKMDRPVLIPYRRWELHELPALTVGSTKEIWAVKTCSAVESPRYIITAFQTDGNSDATLFDNINIMDIRLTLNGASYPHERMRLDFAKNDYVEAHRSYTEFYSSYMNSLRKHAPLLDYAAFKNRALFVIDCSKRTEFMKSTTVDVKLDIESTTGFPANTRAYCIIIHDCIMEYLPLSEIVRQLS